MTNKNPDDARNEYIKMIQDSWTYAKLTEAEREQLAEAIEHAHQIKAIKGTYNQRWQVLNAIYHTFLLALNYTPFNWREEVNA